CVAYRKSLMSRTSRAVINTRALDPLNPVMYRMFGRLVSNMASRCACCTASRSAATRPARGSGTCGEVRDEAAQRELVTRRPQTADNADGAAGQHGVSALRLPRKDVRYVNFHVGHRD